MYLVFCGDEPPLGGGLDYFGQSPTQQDAEALVLSRNNKPEWAHVAVLSAGDLEIVSHLEFDITRDRRRNFRFEAGEE